MFGFERHHSPVSGINGINYILRFVSLQFHCGFLTDFGEFVQRHDLTAHEYGLGKCHGSEKHIVDIEFHRLFWNQSCLRRHGCAVW